MSAPALVPSTAIHDRFLADHRECEDLFARLLAAVAANDREGTARLWNDFEGRLSKHLEAEERYLIPKLFSSCPRAARALLEEHRFIRSRLVELGFGSDPHSARFEAARGFIDELRAHARHEDDVLYRWADEHVAADERSALVAALTASPDSAHAG